MVDTKSNLRYWVLCEILQSIGISVEKFETKSHFIDKSLCDARNSIAHGRELFPSSKEVATLHTEVIEMMNFVRDLILGAVRDQTYKVPISSEASRI
jgi:hypothetical protein